MKSSFLIKRSTYHYFKTTPGPVHTGPAHLSTINNSPAQKINTMKTNLNPVKITIEEMLNRPEQAYNPEVWKSRVNRMQEYGKLQFYVIKPNSVFRYARFYASYIADGIYFFSDFHPFSSMITNRGFHMIRFDADGYIEKIPFKGPDGREGAAENTPANRAYFRKALTPNDIMVSNSI